MWTKVLTTAGLALLARVNKGKLVITKAHAGAGQISDNQLVNAVAISQYKRDLIVTQITNKISAVAIRLELNNTGLGTSFELYQIGIYAKIEGDVSDVLLYIMQSDTAEYIPSAAESTGYINDYVVQVNISQADNISATIDPAGLVTIGQMDNRLDDKVDKVEGKGLSTNDYTTADKNKLAGVADNANNYAHPATHPYSMITGAPTSLPANGGTAANVPWTGVTGKPATFPAATHTHDDRYYTEDEINAQMEGKANMSHTHNRRELVNYELTKNINDIDNDNNYVAGSITESPFGSATWTNVAQFTCYHFITQIAFCNTINLTKIRNRYVSSTVWTPWQTVYTECSITCSTAAPVNYLGEGVQHQTY